MRISIYLEDDLVVLCEVRDDGDAADAQAIGALVVEVPPGREELARSLVAASDRFYDASQVFAITADGFIGEVAR